MFRWLARWIHKAHILDKATEDEQQAFIEALLIILLADNSIEVMEDVNFTRFSRLVNWKFPIDETVKELKRECVKIARSLQDSEAFIKAVAARLPRKELQDYLLSRIRLYFLEGVGNQIGCKLQYFAILKRSFGIDN